MDEDFDIASFDEAYSPEDFSDTEMDFAAAIGAQTGGFGDDETAQTIANYLAAPQVGQNRSNITNLVSIGPGGQRTSLYDPTFAAAFDISRGLDPTNNQGGIAGLAVPSYLRPQIESGRVDARGEPIRYFSPFERTIQEDLPDLIRNIPGPMNLLGRGLDMITSSFTDAKKALGKIGDAAGGLSLSDLMSGVFSSETGQRAMDDMADNVSFDQFGRRIDLGDTRQIADFQQPLGPIQSNLVRNAINQRAMNQRNFQTGYDDDPLIDLQPPRVEEVRPYGIFRDQLGRPQLGFRPTFQT